MNSQRVRLDHLHSDGPEVGTPQRQRFEELRIEDIDHPNDHALFAVLVGPTLAGWVVGLPKFHVEMWVVEIPKDLVVEGVADRLLGFPIAWVVGSFPRFVEVEDALLLWEERSLTEGDWWMRIQLAHLWVAKVGAQVGMDWWKERGQVLNTVT
jgi:hypothetical protein